MNRIRLPGAAVLTASFAAGGVPFANIASTRLAGTDLREVGSGTVSGSALFKVAGFWPLMVVGPLEVGKGALGPLLAGSGRPVLAAAAGTAAIAGHDYSPFLRGAGGRGLAPALGATLVLAPEGVGVLLAGLIVGRCARQTGLGCFLAYLALGPILYRTRGPAGLLTAFAVVGPLLIKRLTGNKPPARRSPEAYLRRLIYDRDEPSAANDQPR